MKYYINPKFRASSGYLTEISMNNLLYNSPKVSFRYLSLWFIVCLCLISTSAFAQTKVTGVVKDAQGETLIGVTVKEKKTSKAVPTNTEGKFSIEVKNPDAVLIFSYVGYRTQSVPLKGRTTLEVVLAEEAKSLDEVVVVGYATQRKVTMTGSVASIGQMEISKAPSGNITSALGGRLPGLITKQSSAQPGRDAASMRIRGLATTGNASPTIIVDGVQRNFDNYDPGEIESITVLKDASAAAVYGVQGAGGVILVTTKRGRNNQKPVFSYNGKISYNQTTDYPKFLSGADFVKYYNKALELDGKKPLFSPEVYSKLINGDPSGKLRCTDWFKEIMKEGAYSTHHNISVAGGSENVKYFMLLGYLSQDGIVDKIDFKRYNLRSNVDVKVGKGFSVGIDLGARHEKRNGGYFGIENQAYNNPLTLAARTLPIIPTTYEGLPTAGSLTNEAINPVAFNELSGYNNSKYSILETTLTGTWDVPFIRGLNLEMAVSYDKDFTNTESWRDPFDINYYNIQKGEYQRMKAILGQPNTQVYRKGSTQTSRLTLQPSINYHRKFGKHDVNALFVYEQSEYNMDNLSGAVQDFDLPFLHEIDLGKSLLGGENAKVGGAVGGSSYIFRRAGFVGRLNYSYADKYLAELAFRYDGSTRFPKNKRWGLFPAGSVGWRISEEDFFQDLKNSIENLKLRASMGLLGNDRINDFAYLNLMMPNAPTVHFGNNDYISVYTSGLANPDITWERTATYNVGFDMTMRGGIFGIEFDYFYKLTSDILMNSSSYPPSLGGNYPGTINGGKVSNKGFELTLSHGNHVGDFYYSVKGNLGWARNKILRMNESPNVPDYLKRTGRRMGEKIGFIAEGLYQTPDEILNSPTLDHLSKQLIRPGDIKYKDINGDGRINSAQDYTVIGKSSFPELMYGLNFNMNWKGLDFSMFFQGAAIMDMGLNGVYNSGNVDGTQYTRPFYGNGNSPYFVIENTWTPTNTHAEFTRLTTELNGNPNGWASSWWIRDASYLRLKNMQLGYTLRNKGLDKMGVSSLRFTLTGSNLLTWSKLNKYHIDPESPEVTNGYYPQQRVFEFGVNITF